MNYLDGYMSKRLFQRLSVESSNFTSFSFDCINFIPKIFERASFESVASKETGGVRFSILQHSLDI